MNEYHLLLLHTFTNLTFSNCSNYRPFAAAAVHTVHILLVSCYTVGTLVQGTAARDLKFGQLRKLGV